MNQSIKSCGTCRYYERTTSRFLAENVGRCQWTYKHQRAAARMPQWVRDADKTVWDEDGKNCATWENADRAMLTAAAPAAADFFRDAN